jgi:adenylate cyclase
MPKWDKTYFDSLIERFNKITDGLDDRLDKVVDGRATPALTDLAIGSARKMRAATIFFDIRHFSSRTSSAEVSNMRKALQMLDCVIPMVMHVIYDYGGYVEKNTGDGVMGIVGAEQKDSIAANFALSIATTTFYALKHIVNPYLKLEGIPKVDARIGIDMGTLLIARIGVPSGTSKLPRSFLTVVGPSANLACRLQERASTNQIWVGDLIKVNAKEDRQRFFKNKTPEDWTWTYQNAPQKTYSIWHYDAARTDPT